MKVCPKCQSKFTDRSLNYCLQDGTVLTDSPDEKTVVFNPAELANEATIMGGVEPDTSQNAANPTDESQMGETTENESVATIIREPQATGSKRGAAIPLKTSGGISFAAGVLIGFLAVGIAGAAVYAGLHFGGVLGADSNSDEDSNKKAVPETEIISNSPAVNVTASSVRKSDQGNVYAPRMAFDGNPRTAWCEGVKGPGRGQWIVFDFDNEITLKEIVIQPGYFKTPEIWGKNNRVSSIVVEFSDKSKRIYDFNNEMKPQTLDAGNTRTKSVFIAIKEIFRGSSDSEDTLISEVSFVTEKTSQ